MKFKLFNPKRKKSGIYLDHHSHGRRFKYGLGITVIVKHWNSNKQRVSELAEYQPDASIINSQLDNVNTRLVRYLNKCAKTGRPITIEDIKYKVDRALGKIEHRQKEEDKDKLSLVDFAYRYVDKNPYRSQPQTLVSVSGSIKAIQKYNEKNPDNQVDFKTFTLEKMKLFVDYWLEKGRKPSTVGRYIKDVRVFIRYAENVKGYKVDQAYKQRGFTIKLEPVPHIYLTPEQVAMLDMVDISKQHRGYRHALDVFLVGCHTGLRFSDIIELTPENIKTGDRKTIHTIQKKTKGGVIIPVKKAVENIIDRLPLQQITNQNLNILIPKIAKLAGIDPKKAAKVSSHTARRSFCTNAYKAGMGIIEIMAISGHKTTNSFMLYINLTKAELAEKAGKHSFMQ